MQALTTIPARFNGPPSSGNGGYSCGLLAAHIEGPARIRLHVPPPLETALRMTRTAGGGVEMFHGDTLVGSAEPAALQLAIPEPPAVDEALAATDGFPLLPGPHFPHLFCLRTRARPARRTGAVSRPGS